MTFTHSSEDSTSEEKLARLIRTSATNLSRFQSSLKNIEECIGYKLPEHFQKTLEEVLVNPYNEHLISKSLLERRPQAKFEPTNALRKQIQDREIEFYNQHVGKVLEVNSLGGYLAKNNDSTYLYLSSPAYVRVEKQPPESIVHWNWPWFDPYWDVQVLQIPPGIDEIRSTWIDGPSVNIITGQRTWEGVRVLSYNESLILLSKLKLKGLLCHLQPTTL